MVNAPVGVAQTLGALWVVSLLHQCGHYYTGRQIVGIPRSEIRIVSLLVPRYVALLDGDEWISPRNFDRFRDSYERHDPSYEHLERYVAGGEIIQALLVVPVSIVLGVAGFEFLATSLLLVSIVVTFVDVVIDAGVTWQTGTPSGDYSALWTVSPRIPALLLLGFLFVHLGAFYFV